MFTERGLTFAPASLMDILLVIRACFGTILTAAYWPVDECFAILTLPLLPFPMVRPMRQGPMVLGSLSSFSLSVAERSLSLRRAGCAADDCCDEGAGRACCRVLGAVRAGCAGAVPGCAEPVEMGRRGRGGDLEASLPAV